MRLVTRSDFDGLICGVLLKEVGLLEEWKFVHPKDVQDGKVEVTENDVLANVPYAPGCGMWFDHHSSEEERHGFNFTYKGESRKAPSCARVIWEYYKGHETFSPGYDEMLRYVDKVDSGDLTAEEIENPKDWVLLGFLMDPRTGLGRYRDYRISNYQLMEDLIEHCRTQTIEEILALPDVKERIDRYYEQQEQYQTMIMKNSTAHGEVLVIDLRDQEEIYTGNRFTPYVMFQHCNVSVQVLWGFKKQNTVITVGYSITNRTCTVNIGKLMLKYGGGGHRAVGTCQVPTEKADQILDEIIEYLK